MLFQSDSKVQKCKALHKIHEYIQAENSYIKMCIKLLKLLYSRNAKRFETFFFRLQH